MWWCPDLQMKSHCFVFLNTVGISPDKGNSPGPRMEHAPITTGLQRRLDAPWPLSLPGQLSIMSPIYLAIQIKSPPLSHTFIGFMKFISKHWAPAANCKQGKHCRECVSVLLWIFVLASFVCMWERSSYVTSKNQETAQERCTVFAGQCHTRIHNETTLKFISPWACKQ